MNDQRANSSTEKLPLEINVQQYMELLHHPSVLVIDVREFGEVPPIKVENHLQIPMSSFRDNNFEQLIAQNIILVCQHGVRSLTAALLMDEKFNGLKNIHSLKGGIVRLQKG